MGFKLRSSGPFKMMGSSPVRQTTTERDETAGDKKLTILNGMYGPGKGKKHYLRLSEKELQDFRNRSPKKIKDIMANNGKATPMRKRYRYIRRNYVKPKKLRQTAKIKMSIFSKIFSSGATELIKGVGEVVDNLTTSKEEKLAAELKVKELISNYETEMEKNITARWDADVKSDSWLAKNVRPLVLLFLVVCTMIMIFIDAGAIKFNVEEKWTELLQMVLITVIGAYFGGRSFEKIKNK
jgi:hypothetical protein